MILLIGQDCPASTARCAYRIPCLEPAIVLDAVSEAECFASPANETTAEKIEALKDLRILRDELVASMPKGKTRQDLMDKAKHRTDLDHWNDAIKGVKQLRLL